MMACNRLAWCTRCKVTGEAGSDIKSFQHYRYRYWLCTGCQAKFSFTESRNAPYDGPCPYRDVRSNTVPVVTWHAPEPCNVPQVLHMITCRAPEPCNVPQVLRIVTCRAPEPCNVPQLLCLRDSQALDPDSLGVPEMCSGLGSFAPAPFDNPRAESAFGYALPEPHHIQAKAADLKQYEGTTAPMHVSQFCGRGLHPSGVCPGVPDLYTALAKPKGEHMSVQELQSSSQSEFADDMPSFSLQEHHPQEYIGDCDSAESGDSGDETSESGDSDISWVCVSQSGDDDGADSVASKSFLYKLD